MRRKNSTEMIVTTVYLPKDLHVAAKAQGINLSQLMREALTPLVQLTKEAYEAGIKQHEASIAELREAAEKAPRSAAHALAVIVSAYQDKTKSPLDIATTLTHRYSSQGLPNGLSKVEWEGHIHRELRTELTIREEARVKWEEEERPRREARAAWLATHPKLTLAEATARQRAEEAAIKAARTRS